MEVNESELRTAVERNFGCSAKFARIVRVTETHQGQTVWDGIVHVFDVGGGQDVAYAWTSPMEGTAIRRFYTVLGKSPINSAADAVRAAIAAESRDKAVKEQLD